MGWWRREPFNAGTSWHGCSTAASMYLLLEHCFRWQRTFWTEDHPSKAKLGLNIPASPQEDANKDSPLYFEVLADRLEEASKLDHHKSSSYSILTPPLRLEAPHRL